MARVGRDRAARTLAADLDDGDLDDGSGVRRRMRMRERMAPLLVLGVVVGTALGVLSVGTDPDLTTGPSASSALSGPITGPITRPITGLEFRPAPNSATRPAGSSDLDVADLRNGGAQPADTQRHLGAANHTGPAVLATESSPRFGVSRSGQPPAAVRLVLEVVAPRLGRAPPNIRVS